MQESPTFSFIRLLTGKGLCCDQTADKSEVLKSYNEIDKVYRSTKARSKGSNCAKDINSFFSEATSQSKKSSKFDGSLVSVSKRRRCHDSSNRNQQNEEQMSLKASTIISPILENDVENIGPGYFQPSTQSLQQPKSFCSYNGSTQSSICQRTSFGIKCPRGSPMQANPRYSLQTGLNSLNMTGTKLRVLQESQVTEVFSKIH